MTGPGRPRIFPSENAGVRGRGSRYGRAERHTRGALGKANACAPHSILSRVKNPPPLRFFRATSVRLLSTLSDVPHALRPHYVLLGGLLNEALRGRQLLGGPTPLPDAQQARAALAPPYAYTPREATRTSGFDPPPPFATKRAARCIFLPYTCSSEVLQ